MLDCRNLQVWQKSHRLTLTVYRVSLTFPSHETFSWRRQLRRSVTSGATNIAKGCGRGSDRVFGHFLQIAPGSASEVEYQVLLARDLGYLEEHLYVPLDRDVKRMLVGLIASVAARRRVHTRRP